MRHPTETDDRLLTLQLLVLNASARCRRIARILDSRPAYRLDDFDVDRVLKQYFALFEDLRKFQDLKRVIGPIDADGVEAETGPQTPDLGPIE